MNIPEKDGIKSPDAAPKAGFLTIFPSIMLPMFMAMIDQTIVASALPAIGSDLGRLEMIAWVVVAYLIAAAISAPVTGRLGDAFGRRKLLIIALFISMAGGLMCALSTSLEMLIASRVLQGLGGGGLMATSQALIGQSVAARERARYQGYIASIAVTASMMGPVVGGFLTEFFGWRSIFLLNLPLGLLAAFLVMRLPPRKGPRDPFRFDWVGLVLFSVFVWSLLTALDQVRPPFDAGQSYALWLGLVAIFALIALIWYERRIKNPLLPLPILRNPSIWRSDVLTMCHGAFLVSLITFMPIYFRAVREMSASEIGLLMLPLTVCLGLGSFITGQLVSRTGATAIMPSIGMPIASIMILILSFYAHEMSTFTVSVLLGVVSIFLGTVMGVVHVTVLSEASSKVLGAASGLIQLSRSLGAATGTAIVGIVLFSVVLSLVPELSGDLSRILQNAGTDEAGALAPSLAISGREAISHAFGYVFMVIGGFGILGSIIAWTIPRRSV